jgi:hypothetical protein
MTSHEGAVGQNMLVALGLWWCFSFLGSLVLWAWDWAFVNNRVFSGPSGSAFRVALSMPGYAIVGIPVGLGVARFIKSSQLMAWAASLALLIALFDANSWNATMYRGRSVAEAGIAAVTIVASIVFGCWVGLRLKARGLEADEVA